MGALHKCREIFCVALCALTTIVSGATLPNIVCQELHVVQVDPRSLRSNEYDSRSMYRFSAGDLYLSSPDRVEYRYGSVVEVEPLRYVVGHKTIQIESSDFRSAILVHIYRDEVRVSRASCTKN
jgi:hypothetical protein